MQYRYFDCENGGGAVSLDGFEKLSIGYIELRSANTVNVSLLERNDVLEIKKKLAARGMGVSAIGSPIGKIETDEDIEPHLETFEGLSEIATKKFDNPYVYNSREEAFEDAARRLRLLI